MGPLAQAKGPSSRRSLRNSRVCGGIRNIPTRQLSMKKSPRTENVLKCWTSAILLPPTPSMGNGDSPRNVEAPKRPPSAAVYGFFRHSCRTAMVQFESEQSLIRRVGAFPSRHPVRRRHYRLLRQSSQKPKPCGRMAALSGSVHLAWEIGSAASVSSVCRDRSSAARRLRVQFRCRCRARPPGEFWHGDSF